MLEEENMIEEEIKQAGMKGASVKNEFLINQNSDNPMYFPVIFINLIILLQNFFEASKKRFRVTE